MKTDRLTVRVPLVGFVPSRAPVLGQESRCVSSAQPY